MLRYTFNFWKPMLVRRRRISTFGLVRKIYSFLWCMMILWIYPVFRRNCMEFHLICLNRFKPTGLNGMITTFISNLGRNILISSRLYLFRYLCEYALSRINFGSIAGRLFGNRRIYRRRCYWVLSIEWRRHQTVDCGLRVVRWRPHYDRDHIMKKRINHDQVMGRI